EPGSVRLASASLDGTVRIWDVQAGLELSGVGDGGILSCLAFSRDGRYLASGSRWRTVKVWNATTWQLLHERPDPTGMVESMAFHPKEESVLAWGSSD